MPAPVFWPAPFQPDPANQTQPEVAFDAQVQSLGQRFGWMRSHKCPCVGSSGSADPRCRMCGGRAVYWEEPLPFLGFFTYMHTSAAPDEPGAFVNVKTGLTERAEPTLSIPKGGQLREADVWQWSSLWDAFTEYDAIVRFSDVLSLSDGVGLRLNNPVSAKLISVTGYNPASRQTVPVDLSTTSLTNGIVSIQGASPGAAYEVVYTAVPTYVAYRAAGGMPHTRPFAQGRTGLPRRFHLQALDVWLRSQGGQAGGVNFAEPSFDPSSS